MFAIFRYFNVLLYVMGILSFLQLVFYLYSHVIKFLFLRQIDLKKKYKSNWAVVTGGSSGIGRGVVDILLGKGLNIFVIALDDDLMTETIELMHDKHPDREIVPIPIDFFKEEGYIDKMDEIIRSHTDDVGIVINNAGVIKMGDFAEQKAFEFDLMMKVNVESYLNIAHYFMKRWVSEKRENGFLSFTSSCSIYYHQPFCSVYTASKYWVRSFAGSLALEAATHNIDVLCINPQVVVGTTFWPEKGVSAYAPLKVLMKLLPSTPQSVAKAYVAAMGQNSVRDIGWLANVLYLGTGLFMGTENGQMSFYRWGCRNLPFLKLKKE